MPVQKIVNIMDNPYSVQTFIEAKISPNRKIKHRCMKKGLLFLNGVLIFNKETKSSEEQFQKMYCAGIQKKI